MDTPHSFDALHWGLLGLIALLAVSLLLVLHSHRELDRRVSARELASPSTGDQHAVIAETRRAHTRLDNLQRQFDALAKDVGWSDDHHATKVLGSRLDLFRLPPKK